MQGAEGLDAVPWAGVAGERQVQVAPTRPRVSTGSENHSKLSTSLSPFTLCSWKESPQTLLSFSAQLQPHARLPLSGRAFGPPLTTTCPHPPHPLSWPRSVPDLN